MYNPKKAQVNEEELESNDQLLVINTSDMIDTQNEGFERVNKMFGTNISCELAEDFKIDEKGVEDNAGTNSGQYEVSSTDN